MKRLVRCNTYRLVTGMLLGLLLYGASTMMPDGLIDLDLGLGSPIPAAVQSESAALLFPLA
tara:strand:- start:778 stop:960 length:183 start_codon:yes stop_codon:yes gene_type:complete